jgi:HPt (histidine-containing phosphotransfer) domain-containing protein
MNSVLILNRDTLQESTGGDGDFARELFSDYVPRGREISLLLAKAGKEKNSEALRKTAHEIKGSSLTLGLDQVGEAARRLESAGRAGDLSDVETLLAQFQASFQAALEMLVHEGFYQGE